MFVLAHAILGAYGIQTASLGDPDALRAVLGASALAPLFPVIASRSGSRCAARRRPSSRSSP